MGCGCGGAKKKKVNEFVVTKPGGEQEIVSTRAEAIRLAQQTKGKWNVRPKTV